MPQGERCSFPLTVTMDEGRTLICEKNRITLTAEGAGAAAQCGIGVIGKTPYRLYGPFWENIVEVPPLAVGESYYGKIPGATDEEYADNVRCYHLNTRVSVGRDYISEAEMTASAQRRTMKRKAAWYLPRETTYTSTRFVHSTASARCICGAPSCLTRQ